MLRLVALAVLIAGLAGCVEGPEEPQVTPRPEQESDGPASGAPALPSAQVEAAWDAAMARLMERLDAGEPLEATARRFRDGPLERVVTGPEEVQRDVRLLLQRVNVLDGAWVQVAGQPAALPPLATYVGHADGDEDALARLLVTPTWAWGSVRDGDHVYEVRLGILPESDAGREAAPPRGAATHLEVPFEPEGPGLLDCFSDPVVGGQRDPTSLTPRTKDGRSVDAPVTARLVLSAEAGLDGKLGLEAAYVLALAALELDAVFDHEVGIRFQVAGLALREPPLDGAPFEALAQRWSDRGPARDLLLHFPLEFLDGRTGTDGGGQAACIGSAGYPDHAFALIGLTARDAGTAQWMRYLVAHETGHLFNAVHDDGNAVESDAGTLMCTCATVAGTNPVFGSLERSVIRGWAESHL